MPPKLKNMDENCDSALIDLTSCPKLASVIWIINVPSASVCTVALVESKCKSLFLLLKLTAGPRKVARIGVDDG